MDEKEQDRRKMILRDAYIYSITEYITLYMELYIWNPRCSQSVYTMRRMHATHKMCAGKQYQGRVIPC